MLGVGVESVCSQAQGRVVGVRDRARELLLHIFQLGEYQYVIVSCINPSGCPLVS